MAQSSGNSGQSSSESGSTGAQEKVPDLDPVTGMVRAAGSDEVPKPRDENASETGSSKPPDAHEDVAPEKDAKSSDAPEAEAKPAPTPEAAIEADQAPPTESSAGENDASPPEATKPETAPKPGAAEEATPESSPSEKPSPSPVAAEDLGPSAEPPAEKTPAAARRREPSKDETTAPPPTSGASVYAEDQSAVRAPGWPHSGQIRVDRVKEPRHRPQSAPALEPASVPNLKAIPRKKSTDSLRPEPLQDPDLELEEVQSAGETRVRFMNTGPMTPAEGSAPPPAVRDERTRDARHKVKAAAVDNAVKELARAAVAAEIERDEKRALLDYQPEEGEIPPSPEVAKRFDVILQLGKGGMGVVYLCRDPRRRGKVLAVKDIRTELKPGMRIEERVEHEVMLLTGLDHPGIVKVFDLLKFPRGSAIVMEYIDGLPLDHEIGAGRRITWDFGARVLEQIGAALQYAHDHGVIHRDIKPDNILYSERHNIMKLVDFGLAQLYGDEVDISMTRTGMVVGTPHYMSPEQVSGKQLDQRSDIYSFGATLYYLLTGQRHVEGSNVMDILEQQRSRSITPPSHLQRDIPGWLSYIIGKMMEIDPEARYSNMADVLEDLRKAQDDPDNFVLQNPLGPVRRYGDLPLTPFGADENLETDEYDPTLGEPSAEDSVAGDKSTARRSRRTTAVQDGEQPAEELEPASELAELVVLVREMSGRLERTERAGISSLSLFLIIMLSAMIAGAAMLGGLIYLQREGHLHKILDF